jgi:hypothetical protein
MAFGPYGEISQLKSFQPLACWRARASPILVAPLQTPATWRPLHRKSRSLGIQSVGFGGPIMQSAKSARCRNFTLDQFSRLFKLKFVIPNQRPPPDQLSNCRA